MKVGDIVEMKLPTGKGKWFGIVTSLNADSVQVKWNNPYLSESLTKKDVVVLSESR